MEQMTGMFSGLPGGGFGYGMPDDSQCGMCGLFDTSRQDVLEVIHRRQADHPKSIRVSQYRCRCLVEAVEAVEAQQMDI